MSEPGREEGSRGAATKPNRRLKPPQARRPQTLPLAPLDGDSRHRSASTAGPLGSEPFPGPCRSARTMAARGKLPSSKYLLSSKPVSNTVPGVRASALMTVPGRGGPQVPCYAAGRRPSPDRSPEALLRLTNDQRAFARGAGSFTDHQDLRDRWPVRHWYVCLPWPEQTGGPSCARPVPPPGFIPPRGHTVISRGHKEREGGHSTARYFERERPHPHNVHYSILL